MTTKGEGRTDAILYAVFLLVCLGSGLLLHMLSARSVPGVFKLLVGAVFDLSGVITLAGIFKAIVWTVKACRAYRTEYRKLAVVASLVVVVVVTAVVVHHLTANPIQQYWPTNRVVLSQLITVDDQIMAISDPPASQKIKEAQTLEGKAVALEQSIHVEPGSPTLMKEEYGFAHHAYLVGVKAVVLIEHNVSSQTSARSSLANELLNNFNAALTDYNRTTPASSGP